MSSQVWRQLPGLPRYEVSDWGRVRSRQSGKLMKILHSTGGSAFVRLYPGESRAAHGRGQLAVNKLVAQAVLEAFLGPRPAGLSVSHLDRNPDNNRLQNLAYETLSAIATRRRLIVGGPKAVTAADRARVKALRKLGHSQHSIAKQTGIGYASVARITGGTKSRAKKLTPACVRQIRVMAAAGLTNTAIGKAFGVSDNMVGFIRRGMLWSHIR